MGFYTCVQGEINKNNNIKNVNLTAFLIHEYIVTLCDASQWPQIKIPGNIKETRYNWMILQCVKKLFIFFLKKNYLNRSYEMIWKKKIKKCLMTPFCLI